MPIEKTSFPGSAIGANASNATSGNSIGPDLAAAPASLRGANVQRCLSTDGSLLSVHLLFFDLGSFVPADFAATGVSCPASVARSVRKRQAEFLFGRLAARQALSAAAPSDAAVEVTIGSTREPIWPTGIIGSISHCDNVAAAIAEPRGTHSGIGIDLERIAAGEACEALLASVVSEQETALLRELAGGRWSIETLLTLVFSAKESLFKGAFAEVGRYFDFSAAQLVSMDLERRLLRFAFTETLCDRFPEAQRVEVGFDFVEPDLLLTHFVW